MLKFEHFSLFINLVLARTTHPLLYKISGILECLHIDAHTNGKIAVNPLKYAIIQLWEEDRKTMREEYNLHHLPTVNIELLFGLQLDQDDFLGETVSQENGKFNLTAAAEEMVLGLDDLEPYLRIRHRCTGNSEKLHVNCWLYTRYDLSALPEVKQNLGIRLGFGSRLKTWQECD